MEVAIANIVRIFQFSSCVVKWAKRTCTYVMTFADGMMITQLGIEFERGKNDGKAV